MRYSLLGAAFAATLLRSFGNKSPVCPVGPDSLPVPRKLCFEFFPALHIQEEFMELSSVVFGEIDQVVVFSGH